MKVIILFLTVLFSQVTFAQEKRMDNVYSFPIKVGDEQWRKLGSTHERISALQIPIMQLDGLTTEELLDVCLDYPYLPSMAFCDDYQSSVELLISQFNGLQELIKRKDIIRVLLNKERNMINEYEKIASYSLTERGKFAFQWLFIDLLFIQKEIKTRLNNEQLMEFSEVFDRNQSFRYNNPMIFKGMDSISESLLSKNGIIIGNNTRSWHAEYESVTIYTPHSTVVPNAQKLIGDDVSISPAMEQQLEAHIYSVYDSAQVVEPSTFRYDISGWTWHTSTTGEKVVIPYNNDVVYRSDGSYIQVPEQLATKVIYGNNLFSATIDSQNWYISKWGSGGPLVRHHPTSLPNGTDTYWSPDNPNYYPLAQRTYYMRNPDCYITGPVFIASGFAVFSLHNLPSGCTVSWSLSDSYYNDHCLISNQPSPNQCVIYHDDNHSMMNETLTASVKYNDTTILTKTKSGLYSYNGFWGQYTSGNLSGEINYTHYFNIRTNATTYIKSPNFYGATVTYSSSGATPTIWGFSPSNGDLTFVTTTPNSAVVINVTDGGGNSYVLYAYATNQYGLNVSNEGNSITVTLNDDDDSQRDSSIDQSWTIEVRNVTTGQLMATQSSTSRSESISTVGWPKGIYVVTVTIGKEVLTEKVIVR